MKNKIKQERNPISKISLFNFTDVNVCNHKKYKRWNRKRTWQQNCFGNCFCLSNIIFQNWCLGDGRLIQTAQIEILIRLLVEDKLDVWKWWLGDIGLRSGIQSEIEIPSSLVANARLYFTIRLFKIYWNSIETIDVFVAQRQKAQTVSVQGTIHKIRMWL